MKALKAANNTLSLFLPYFFMFLYTNTQFSSSFCVVEKKISLFNESAKSRKH